MLFANDVVVLCMKAAQAVLINLYNLNQDEFTVMLSVLPKTFQVRLLLAPSVEWLWNEGQAYSMHMQTNISYASFHIWKKT